MDFRTRLDRALVRATLHAVAAGTGDEMQITRNSDNNSLFSLEMVLIQGG